MVLGDDDVPVGPVERYLAYLTDVERSPNTVKAYAHDLKDYWTFLTFRGLDWREVRRHRRRCRCRGDGELTSRYAQPAMGYLRRHPAQ
jgi:site-specific recombinase XerD